MGNIENKTPRKRGRASNKSNDEFVVSTLEECLENGFTVAAACEAASIDQSSYYLYARTNKVFADRIELAILKCKLKVKDRIIERTKKAQEYVDDVFAGRRFKIKRSVTFDANGNIQSVIETKETLLPDKWILEKYLPVDIKPEETQEQITVNVNFSDDAPIDTSSENENTMNYSENDDNL